MRSTTGGRVSRTRRSAGGRGHSPVCAGLRRTEPPSLLALARRSRTTIVKAGGESHHPWLRHTSLADGKARLAFRQGTEQHPRVPYDVVLSGGRVLDPESGLDRRCDV